VRRIQRPKGQLLLSFDLIIEDLQPKVVEPHVAEPVVETALPAVALPPAAPVLVKPKPAKQRVKHIWKHEGPSVTLHKKGRYLLLKANDPTAAMHWHDVKERFYVEEMRSLNFFDPNAGEGVSLGVDAVGAKLRLHELLGTNPEDHIACQILRSYGVHVFVSPTLKNWLVKEKKRQELEATPFPAPAVVSSANLYERCGEGLILKCIKNYTEPNGTKVLFEKGKRYIVVGTSSEGTDSITLSTKPVEDKAQINLASEGNRHLWTSFDEAMEKYFDDSEETEIGETVVDRYPGLIAYRETELKALNLKLYSHVERDAALAALKKSALNAYPMRMGKTSFAIAWAKLCKNTPVAFIGPRNARIFTVNELNRLGFVQDVDYVVVDSLADLEKPAWMYLLTYSWVKKGKDLTSKDRGNWENYLRPSLRTIRRRTGSGKNDWENVDQHLRNNCPHCEQPMERLKPLADDASIPDNAVCIQKMIRGKMEDTYWVWTFERGYRCRNADCRWFSDNRAKEGAAWNTTRKPVTHHGGYVDFGLAAHANCEDKQPKGRLCPTCGVTEGVWNPQLSRRLRKRFNLIVVDEIHSTKDKTTDVAHAIYRMRAKRRIGLTGTPISNAPVDVYWPLHWLVGAPTPQMPFHHTGGFKEFDERFCEKMTLEKPIGEEIDEVTGKKTKLTKTVSKRIPFLKNPPDFWRFMLPKVIRRNYTDPLFVKTLEENKRFMPKADILKTICPMDPEQAKIMLASIKDFKSQYEKMLKAAEEAGQNLNSALVISQMSTLKKVATIPDMLNEQFPGTYSGIKGGGKMEYIKTITEDALEKQGKVVILSDFRTMHNVLYDELRHYGAIRFNTSWDDEARRDAFEAFQYGDAKIFIAGTRAVREGVDLSAADTCICTDLLWSPAFQTQAWSRIMAPSERERLCKVYLMLSANSLDEHIYTVFYSKMVAAEQALDRKSINRRAQEFDVKWFVDRVLEEETAIQSFLVEAGSNSLIVGDLDVEDMEMRQA
jgi:hypothetical protein